jgi:hypothetical protein
MNTRQVRGHAEVWLRGSGQAVPQTLPLWTERVSCEDSGPLEIEVHTSPTRDVVLTFKLSSTSSRILLPVAGFKSRYLQLFSVAFPLSVCADRVEIRIEQAQIRNTGTVQWVDVLEAITAYRLLDGNIGILVPLEANQLHDVILQVRLYDFIRSDILTTELVQGLFPPSGWKDQDIQIKVRGTLQTATWGQKAVAGVHNCKTGRRIQGKFRPSGHFWRLLRTGNDIAWDFPVLNFSDGNEVRLRIRASRLPMLAPVSPFLVTGITGIVLLTWFVIQVITPLVSWVSSLIGRIP